MYRTGDRARWCRDGTIEYLGRADCQVKIRGVRVELTEIEAALEALESVEQAVCVATHDSSGDRQLVACVVPRQGAAIDPSCVRENLAASLPGSIVPTQFLAMDRLPTTAHGKIDRVAVARQLDHDKPKTTSRGGHVAPETAAERELASIWQELLGGPPIGATDNFFDRGGHSLLAARVMSRIGNRLSVKLPTRQLFETPTIHQLARVVDRLRTMPQTEPVDGSPASDGIARTC
jgi:hypothetical protein